jgi:hypothetical protein
MAFALSVLIAGVVLLLMGGFCRMLPPSSYYDPDEEGVSRVDQIQRARRDAAPRLARPLLTAGAVAVAVGGAMALLIALF